MSPSPPSNTPFFGYRTIHKYPSGRRPRNTDSVIVPFYIYLDFVTFHHELLVPNARLVRFFFYSQGLPMVIEHKLRDIFDFFVWSQRSKRLVTFTLLLNNFDSSIVSNN